MIRQTRRLEVVGVGDRVEYRTRRVLRVWRWFIPLWIIDVSGTWDRDWWREK